MGEPENSQIPGRLEPQEQQNSEMAKSWRFELGACLLETMVPQLQQIFLGEIVNMHQFAYYLDACICDTYKFNEYSIKLHLTKKTLNTHVLNNDDCRAYLYQIIKDYLLEQNSLPNFIQY